MKVESKKVLKYLLGIILVAIAILSIINIFKSNLSILKIKTTPNDATITVNNKHISIGTFEMELENGIYNIKVEKDGYITDNRQFELNKNSELKIELTSIFQKTIDTDQIQTIKTPSLSVISKDNSNNILGIDSTNGNLLKIQNDTPITIYAGNVKDYYLNNNLVVILDDDNLSRIILLNIENQTLNYINLPNLYPIISVTLSSDNNTVYFLAEFNIERKTPILYSIPTSGGEPVKILETQALYIEYIKDNLLLLYEVNHETDENYVHLFNTDKNTNLTTKKTNTYSISPNKDQLLLQTTKDISVYNLKNLNIPKKVTTDGGSRSVWKDENTIIAFKNDSNGINFAEITLSPLEITPSSVLIRDMAVQSVYGILDNKIYLQNYDGNVLTLNIPQ